MSIPIAERMRIDKGIQEVDALKMRVSALEEAVADLIERTRTPEENEALHQARIAARDERRRRAAEREKEEFEDEDEAVSEAPEHVGKTLAERQTDGKATLEWLVGIIAKHELSPYKAEMDGRAVVLAKGRQELDRVALEDFTRPIAEEFAKAAGWQPPPDESVEA